TFSFEAHLPPGSALALPSPANPTVVAANHREMDRVQQSRRRFAEMALSLRRRVRELEAEHQGEQQVVERERHELDRLEQGLRDSHQDRLRKGGDPDPGPPELDNSPRHLRREAEKLHEDQQEQARQLESDRADYEADLVRLRVELEDQRRELAT